MDIHTYISDELYAPGNHLITAVAWNPATGLIAAGQDNGEITISTLVTNEYHNGIISISKLFTLVEHNVQITSLSWNTANNKLVSSDHGGKLVVWTVIDSKWVPLLINDLSKVPILQVLNSPNSELVAILYANGKLICGNINGSQKWNTSLDFLPKAMCWAANSKNVFVADNRNNIYLLREYATKVYKLDISSLGIDRLSDTITNLFWNKRESGTILITFRSGIVGIFRERNEVNPVKIFTESKITHAVWASDGSRFVIAGKNPTNNRVFIRFYSVTGNIIRTMELDGNHISDIAFSADDTRLAVAIDSKLTIIQTVPRVSWVYFQNTLVYSVPSFLAVDRTQSKVVYFNTKSEEKHIKEIDNLISIAASKGRCALLSNAGGESAIIITTECGVPIFDNFISFEPKFITLTEDKCIIGSTTKICIWDFLKDSAKFTSYDYEITAIGARNNTLFVTFTTCSIISINLKTMQETGHFTTPRQVEAIDVSSDSTMVSLIDVFGFLCILDINSGTFQEVLRRETWGNKWAADSPSLFASLEKQNIYIYKSMQPIERIPTMASICEFQSLSILSVDFVRIFKNPLQPDLSSFNRYDTKPINDIRLLLKSYKTSLRDEISNYVSSFDCPFAWYMLAEFALGIDDSNLAEKCFTLALSNDVVVITRWMRNISDKTARKVYAWWFLGHTKEALDLIGKTGRMDLMDKVQALDAELSLANPSYSARRNFINGKWKDAAANFFKSGDTRMVVQCLANSDDIVGLTELMEKIPKNSESLKYVGEKFLTLGAPIQAVAAFMKLGQPQLAADAYAHFNMWREALKIANANKEVDRKAIVSRFAAHLADANRNCKAAKTLIHCKIYHEAAVLLEKEGDVRLKRGIEYLMAKKLYVFSSFNWMRALKVKNERISIFRVWHKAEAVHYLLLAHRLINEKKYEEALFPAARVLFAYNDVIIKETSAALLAIAGFNSGYFKECSCGFAFLEHSQRISAKKRGKLEQLAVNIFMKKSPDDSQKLPDVACQGCGMFVNQMMPACRCGIPLVASIVSGKPVSKDDKVWKCKKCRHCALQTEMTDIKICPLCHSRV